MARKGKKHREGGAKRRTVRGTNQALSPRSRASIVLTDRLGKLVPRPELISVIEAAAHGDPARCEKFRLLLGDLINPTPATRRKSFTTLAWERGLRYPEMLDAVRRYRMDIALLRSTAHIDAVLDGLAEDAKRHPTACIACGGAGVIKRKQPQSAVVEGTEVSGPPVEVESPCPVCGGKGTVMEPGDPQARRLFAEAHGIVGKPGGPTINVDASHKTLNVAAEAGGLEELLRRTRQAQAGTAGALPAPTIDAKEPNDGVN